MTKRKPRPTSLEIIGRRISVVESNNKNLLGIEGEVIDETRNMLVIATEKGRKTLIKAQVTIKINDEIIKGSHLLGRPEERVKRS